tara:strand:+ start:100 stop:429 length:330 start_codon:yes stop_codon:yes gene_type:complete
MEYIYAALLLHKLDKEITEDSVSKIIEAGGIKPDEVKVKALASALGEVNIEDVLKNSVLPAVAPVAGTAPVSESNESSSEEESKEDKKSEASDEKKEEEALSGLSSLFG